jgi:hypothetical protein
VLAARSDIREFTMAVAAASRGESEKETAAQVEAALRRQLAPDYAVHVGKNLLYKIEVDAFGKISPGSIDSPTRGQYAFQTDILIEKQNEAVPLVVVELKYGSFTSHDVITYSSKAARHKEIYPYLRYGFVVVGMEALSRKFLTHNAGFDFAMALPDVKSHEAALASLIRRQIASADCVVTLMRSSRARFSRYEETVQIGN